MYHLNYNPINISWLNHQPTELVLAADMRSHEARDPREASKSCQCLECSLVGSE